MGRRILNITNFVRACEPRYSIDLPGTARKEIALCSEFGYPSTSLLQYDALIDPVYTDAVREHMPLCEPGLWLEIVQPLSEAAGISWRGRYPWDWHANVGFTIGYSPEERERLADCAFQKFRSVFGFYPKSVGCWFFDAHTLAYLYDRYRIQAACICQDQLGIDGYTLQGGVFRAGYYPSRKNMLCPSQTAENQIGVPVFRMSATDPIHAYDSPEVLTLEPACGHCGGNSDWCRWTLEEAVRNPCLSHTYLQAGQENSFGWDAIGTPLRRQFELFQEYRDRGVIEIEHMSESGRRFSASWPMTPPSACAALTDWREDGVSSLWYNCKNYRSNLLNKDGFVWLRDLCLMDENYPERYLDRVEETPSCTFGNLPVVADGNNGLLAPSGLFVSDCSGRPLPLGTLLLREDGNSLTAACGPLGLDFSENALTFTCRENYCLRFAVPPDGLVGTEGERTLLFMRDGYSYCLTLSCGRISCESVPVLLPDTFGKLRMIFKN